MKRSVVLFVFAALFCAGGVFAQCRSDDLYLTPYNQPADATTYKNDLSLDLSDYGVIFEEAAPWSGCTQAAADALYKKVYTTFNPLLAGKEAWPHHDRSVCPHDPTDPNYKCADPYQGWLSGGDVALANAAALRLANVGKLTKPLDDLLQRVNASYQLNVDLYCGFDGLVYDIDVDNGTYVQRWTKQNSCMEDYSIGAMAWAWVAAYKSLRGFGGGTEAGYSRTAITNALSTDHFSICAWDGRTNVDPAPPSPCAGDLNSLRNGYIPISMHGGDSIPYGLGLFTSLASAAVGLRVSGNQLSLGPDETFAIHALYDHSLPYTDGTLFSNPGCYQFSLSGSALVVSTNGNCGDGNKGSQPYKATMFPVKDFISYYAPQPPLTSSYFSTFDPALFCDTSVDPPNSFFGCSFWSPGRRSVYGQMAQTWIQYPPNFVNTGLSDYTVTLRTVNGNYLSARDGGGLDVNAEPTFAGSSEQFSIVLRDGSTTINDGDTLTLQSMTSDKAQWVVAEDGGGPGKALNANRLYPHSWETFTIHKLNGTGAINNGDPVALTSVGGYYVSAMNGGGSTVTVDRTAALSWETFTISITHN
jgi:hypothetical protein